MTIIFVPVAGIQLNVVPSTAFQPRLPNSIVLKLDFPVPTIAELGSGDSVTMPMFPEYGAPGEPVLPFRLVRILIPQGKNVKHIDVAPDRRTALAGTFRLTYGQTPMPISSNDSVVDKPNEAIYSSTKPFPDSLSSGVTEQYFRGYKILLLRINPVQYVPKTGELFFFGTITLTVALEETDAVSPFFRNLPQDRAAVMNMVDNSEAAETYRGSPTEMHYAALATSSTHYDYVLITNNTLRSSFQPLADWKNQKGLNATTMLIEDIMNNPEYNSNGRFGDGDGSPKFNDTQAHIRNFIKDAYTNWGVEYVLLGGDDDILPARGLYDYANDSMGDYTDYNIPSDLYYGALDGSWDKNNDSIFGEAVYHWSGPQNATAGEEADFLAEVYVGRAPVSTPLGATNFVNKTIAYEQSTNADYLKKALVIGTKLDDITEGGNGEDAVTDLIPQYTSTRLYSMDGTYSRTAVINELGNGTHIINHDGHSNYVSVMGLSRSDVDNLANTQYFLVYSLGCYSAAFDQATSGPQQAIAEHFLFSSHGAFAYIGNSRYGWYCSSSIDGPGDRYDRSFFSVVNSGTRHIGKALQLSKEQEPILDRWTYFDLNLLGDPETELVTEIMAPTAHFQTRKDLLTPPRIGGVTSLRGTAKRGTAPNANFTNYLIELGQGTTPTSWTTTGINLTDGGTNEVNNGVLATWNTSQIVPDTYTLRLITYGATGLIGEDRQVIQVTQSAIPVYIKSDGSVDPPTAPIERNGNFYTMTDDITSDGEGIVIQRDGITLNGAGYNIQGGGGGGAGIYLFGITNVTIENLTVNAHLYGVYLEQCSNNTVFRSNLVNNTHGVFLLASSRNIIIRCNVTDNYDGISLLSRSDNNSVTGNRITGNLGDLGSGIYLYQSSNNSMYHNTFINNRIHVYDAVWDCSDPGLILPSINMWDNGYPSGGNYWDNYSGSDQYGGSSQNIVGSDGIGDGPIRIDVNNRDRYPVMTPFVLGHDIAITNVASLKTVVGQGYCTNISVIVTNYGEFDEGYNLSVFVDSAPVIQTAATVTATDAVIILSTWNTSGYAFGNHTIKVVADTLPGETNTANNVKFATLPVHVGWAGDVSGPLPGVYDGIVNMRDISYMILVFNSKPASANWNPNADVNNDGIVNMRDIQIAILNFNKHE